MKYSIIVLVELKTYHDAVPVITLCLTEEIFKHVTNFNSLLFSPEEKIVSTLRKKSEPHQPHQNFSAEPQINADPQH
jgi:hypothetical protein